VWQPPAELAEPRQGPVVNHDDLLDFHHLLDRQDWFEQVVALVGR
jgi:hypothetical protein